MQYTDYKKLRGNTYIRNGKLPSTNKMTKYVRNREEDNHLLTTVTVYVPGTELVCNKFNRMPSILLASDISPTGSKIGNPPASHEMLKTSLFPVYMQDHVKFQINKLPEKRCKHILTFNLNN